MPPLSARPKPADGVLETSVGDEIVLYDGQCQQAYTLNPPAAAVWAHCDGERRLADIVAALDDVVDAPREVLERDVVAIVQRLQQQQLLILTEAHAHEQ